MNTATNGGARGSSVLDLGAGDVMPEPPPAPWADQIPEEQWRVYAAVLQDARAAGVPVALGGAFALASYTGTLRNTKDLDLYVLPDDIPALVEVMLQAGLRDYYDELPYDRRWIFRGTREGVIVDAIWAMANQRARVDAAWLTRGPEFTVRGLPVRTIPAEELAWSKLYILQRSRCDWTDVLNLLQAVGPGLDWPHLVARVGEDQRLLAGVLSVFAWLEPDRARMIPAAAWEALRLPFPEEGSPELARRRADLLDSRPWFLGSLPRS